MQSHLTKSTMGAKDTLHPLGLTVFHTNQLWSRAAAASRCKCNWALPKYQVVACVSSKRECREHSNIASEPTASKLCPALGWVCSRGIQRWWLISALCSLQPQTGSDRPQAVPVQPDPCSGSACEAQSMQNSGFVLPIRLYPDHIVFFFSSVPMLQKRKSGQWHSLLPWLCNSYGSFFNYKKYGMVLFLNGILERQSWKASRWQISEASSMSCSCLSSLLSPAMMRIPWRIGRCKHSGWWGRRKESVKCRG